jgi:hypothetical protein
MSSDLRYVLAGIAGTAFFTLLALAFPNLSRFLTIPGALLTFGLTIYFLWPAWQPLVCAPERAERQPIWQRFAVGGGIAIALGLLFAVTDWFSSPEQKLPGFTAYVVLRLYDTPEFRRRYVFEFVTSDGAKVSFYLSASSQFTFAVEDIHGETYPLEVKVGGEGIPIDRFIALFCEVGETPTSTVLRILVNGREIVRRDLPFSSNLGKLDWRPGALGAPLVGQNQGGVFLLFEIGIFAEMLTDKNAMKLVHNVSEHMKLPFD